MYWFLITCSFTAIFLTLSTLRARGTKSTRRLATTLPLWPSRWTSQLLFFSSFPHFIVSFILSIHERLCLTKMSCAGGPRHQGPAGAHGVPRLLPRRQARQEGQAWSRSVRSSSPVRREALPNYKSNFWQTSSSVIGAFETRL